MTAVFWLLMIASILSHLELRLWSAIKPQSATWLQRPFIIVHCPILLNSSVISNLSIYTIFLFKCCYTKIDSCLAISHLCKTQCIPVLQDNLFTLHSKKRFSVYKVENCVKIWELKIIYLPQQFEPNKEYSRKFVWSYERTRKKRCRVRLEYKNDNHY